MEGRGHCALIGILALVAGIGIGWMIPLFSPADAPPTTQPTGFIQVADKDPCAVHIADAEKLRGIAKRLGDMNNEFGIATQKAEAARDNTGKLLEIELERNFKLLEKLNKCEASLEQQKIRPAGEGPKLKKELVVVQNPKLQQALEKARAETKSCEANLAAATKKKEERCNYSELKELREIVRNCPQRLMK